MGALKLGRGIEEGVQVGPLINEEQRGKVEELVEDAVQRGREARRRRPAPRRPRLLLRADRAERRPRRRRLLKEEIFGPVAPVKAFADEQEAIRWANDTEYGLVAYVYTRDLGARLQVMEGLEYGMVGLNRGMVSDPAAPFGGVKHSGVGREGGFEGIEEYLETKYCALTV